MTPKCRLRPFGHRKMVPTLLLLLIGIGLVNCSDPGTAGGGDQAAAATVPNIADAADFDQLIAESGDRILLVDFYADWCAPCKLLAPIIEEVAVSVTDVADVYRVDVDRNRDLAMRMGISGIPVVVLFQSGRPLERLPGLLPRDTYIDAVRRAARSPGLKD